mgnify:CR=1 FL=1
MVKFFKNLFKSKARKALEKQVEELKQTCATMKEQNSTLTKEVQELKDGFKSLAETVENQLNEIGGLTPQKLMREWFDGGEETNEQK